MHDARGGQGPGIVATYLEIRWIGDNDVKVLGEGGWGQQFSKRPQSVNLGSDEVGELDPRRQPHATAAAPIRQVAQNGSKWAAQGRVVLVGDQLDTGQRFSPGGETLYRGAAQNACASRWVQQPQGLRGHLNLRRHEIRNGYGREVESMRFAVRA